MKKQFTFFEYSDPKLNLDQKTVEWDIEEEKTLPCQSETTGMEGNSAQLNGIICCGAKVSGGLCWPICPFLGGRETEEFPVTDGVRLCHKAPNDVSPPHDFLSFEVRSNKNFWKGV
ncbi:MAG: hypothetical protein GY801_01890 [bacterium]|nr:hypothetical protein [bacterium]